MIATLDPPTKTVYDRTVGELRALRQCGLFTNAHECILALTLFDAGEPIPMSVAAKTVGISRAAMTSMVDRFETIGVAVRIESDSDRRNTLLSLTESGTTKVYNALETGWEA
jgi:DNA-binding MarR family transcriptional regulator